MHCRPHSLKLWPIALAIASASVAVSCHSDALVLYAGEPVPFTMLEGSWEFGSGFRDRQRVVVRTPEHLVAVWEQLEVLSQKTSPPPVDFEGNIVLVAAMGVRGTLGHRIQIIGVFERDDQLVAVVRETSSGSGCFATAVSSPATVVVVPRTSSKVSFLERPDDNC